MGDHQSKKNGGGIFSLTGTGVRGSSCQQIRRSGFITVDGFAVVIFQQSGNDGQIYNNKIITTRFFRPQKGRIRWGVYVAKELPFSIVLRCGYGWSR